MKLNNKGFAITAVLYGILILFVLMVSSYLAILSSRKSRIDYLEEEIEASYNAISTTNFAFTGDVQTFQATVNGKYKLEVWGAQGGSYSDNGYGGYGGYARGEVILQKGDTLYIYVGGQGACIANAFNIGGYNGGGFGGRNTITYYGCGGGGATHIAKKSGELSTLPLSINDILIVAGGGGGASADLSTPGGSGGGYVGGRGTSSSGYNNPICGSHATELCWPEGGTQTEPGYAYDTYAYDTTVIRHGSFGTASQVSNNAAYGGGGGGGFYAGGTGFGTTGSGGSGYIANSLLTNKAMYCYNCVDLNDNNPFNNDDCMKGLATTECMNRAEIKTVNIECAEETATSECAKKKDGFVRITLID